MNQKYCEMCYEGGLLHGRSQSKIAYRPVARERTCDVSDYMMYLYGYRAALQIRREAIVAASKSVSASLPIVELSSRMIRVEHPDPRQAMSVIGRPA